LWWSALRYYCLGVAECLGEDYADGVSIFPCLLAKTDVRPILNALGRIGVNATATPLNLSRVAM